MISRDLKKEYVLKSSSENVSKKDLLACTRVLKKKLNVLGLEKTIALFGQYKKKGVYIRYHKHLHGLSSHNKIGPSRRPYKIYDMIISTLKGFRGFIELHKDKNLKVERILINSTGFMRTGVIIKSHGKAFLKNRKHHSLVFYLQEYPKK